MYTADELAGKYHQFKGKIKERFGELADDEFDRFSGSLDQLVEKIQSKTGEARRTIENYLFDLFGGVQDAASRAASEMHGYTEQAGEAMREGYDRVSSGARQGFDAAQSKVRQKPFESIAVALGAGILVGAVLGLLISSRNRD